MRPTCRKVAGLVCDGEYSHPPTPPGMRQGDQPTREAPGGTAGPGQSWRIPRWRAPPAARQGWCREEAGLRAHTPALLGFLFHSLQPSLWLLWLPHFKDESKVECLDRGRRRPWLFPPRGFVPALQSPPHPHSLASRTDSASGQL